MCCKAADNSSHSLEYVHNCYKIKKICNKAVDICPSPTQFASDKDQEICDKPVDTCSFVFDSVYNRYETQEICSIFVYK